MYALVISDVRELPLPLWHAAAPLRTSECATRDVPGAAAAIAFPAGLAWYSFPAAHTPAFAFRPLCAVRRFFLGFLQYCRVHPHEGLGVAPLAQRRLPLLRDLERGSFGDALVRLHYFQAPCIPVRLCGATFVVFHAILHCGARESGDFVMPSLP